MTEKVSLTQKGYTFEKIPPASTNALSLLLDAILFHTLSVFFYLAGMFLFYTVPTLASVPLLLSFGILALAEQFGISLGYFIFVLPVISIFIIMNILAFVIYFLVIPGKTGDTPGNLMLHIRVIRTDGVKLRHRDRLLRSFAWLFGVIYVAVSAITIIFSEKSQSVGDMLAGTVVIEEK